MIVIPILSFLFKKRMKYGKIFNSKPSEGFDPGIELILKIVKSVCWYLIISAAYHSFQQPIDGAKFGFDGSWPLDSVWFCIDKTCDLVRLACQYRMNIKWD